MTTMSAGRLRRKIRRISNVRGWTTRQKIGVGVWVPVLIVALVLFTGPNRRTSSAAAADVSTTSTTYVMPVLPPLVPAHLSTGKKYSLHDRVVKWVNGIRPRRSVANQLKLRNRTSARLRVGLHLPAPRP